jgi:hypothetical protein
MRQVCAHKVDAWTLYREPTFFSATSVTSARVKIVSMALALADLWQRPCPLAEVSLKYDSEEADARVGRRGQLCGGKHACGAILLPSPTCALTLRLLKKHTQNNQRLCLQRVIIGYPIHLVRSKAVSVVSCVVVRARSPGYGGAVVCLCNSRSATEPVRVMLARDPIRAGLAESGSDKHPNNVTGTCANHGLPAGSLTNGVYLARQIRN